MSTPNFANRNASKIFASECPEEWDADDLMGNVVSEVKGAKLCEKWDNDRNYPGKIFAEVFIESGKWYATIKMILRSGYYSGVNLDWEVDIEDLNEGSSFEMGEEKIPSSLQNRIDSRIKAIEKVYAEYTTPLICRGIFSNGEAVYEKAKK